MLDNRFHHRNIRIGEYCMNVENKCLICLSELQRIFLLILLNPLSKLSKSCLLSANKPFQPTTPDISALH